MTRVRYCLQIVIAAALLLWIPQQPAAESRGAHAQLHALFDEYREGNLQLNPLNAMFEGDYRYNHILGDYLSPEYLRRSRELEEKYLAKLADIDYSALNQDDQLSYDIFKYDRDLTLENFRDDYARLDSLMPVSQFSSLPNFVAQLGGGTSAQPFATVKDYENWLQRAGEFPAWVKQAISNLRQGMKEGVVLPWIIVERTLPQLAAHVTEDVKASVFYKPVQNFPESFTEAERKRITGEFEKSIRAVIVPAYRELHDFLAQEYRPHARETVGIGHLPGGQNWYAYLARFHTTTSLTPAEIHRIGKDLAAQIYGEMEAIKNDVGFKGDMREFFTYLRTDPKFFYDSPEALLDSYRDLKSDVEARLPQVFDLKPKADFIVEPIESFREVSSAAAEYLQPAPDGTRPGIFYVNTHDLKSRPAWEREALFAHEAVPGHHFQIAIAQEQEHLPSFQRFEGPTAYVEGWGLYAETLGYDLRLYSDPYQRIGALSMQIWRANRLVVDTGMHALGWTREQAIEWMQSNSPMTDTDLTAEVERYIAIPGQALAYMIGATRIRQLREEARKVQGKEFDLRTFHRQVLADGAMPLDLLERKIERWVRASP